MPLGMNYRDFIRTAKAHAAGDAAATARLFAGSPTWTPSRGGLSSIPLFGALAGRRPTAGAPGSQPTSQPGQNPVVPFADPSVTSGANMPTGSGFTDMPGGGTPGTGRIPGLPSWATIGAWAWGQLSGGGGSSDATQCAPGRIKVGNQCVDPGAALPGGTPLTVPAGGQATMGVFGVPSVSPVVVGEITSNSGQTSVVRRCPTGLVLGKDNQCYAKGSIPNNLRKWPKAPRPPVSAYDARMMRKYGQGGSKQEGVRRLAQGAGFVVKRK